MDLLPVIFHAEDGSGRTRDRCTKVGQNTMVVPVWLAPSGWSKHDFWKRGGRQCHPIWRLLDWTSDASQIRRGHNAINTSHAEKNTGDDLRELHDPVEGRVSHDAKYFEGIAGPCR